MINFQGCHFLLRLGFKNGPGGPLSTLYWFCQWVRGKLARGRWRFGQLGQFGRCLFDLGLITVLYRRWWFRRHAECIAAFQSSFQKRVNRRSRGGDPLGGQKLNDGLPSLMFQPRFADQVEMRFQFAVIRFAGHTLMRLSTVSSLFQSFIDQMAST